MAEPARHLHALQGGFDLTTGEIIEPGCAGCQEKEDQLEGLKARVASLAGNVTRLKRELARMQGLDPGSQDVRAVLDYWADRMVGQGYWSNRPQFVPGQDFWSAVSARLKEHWTVDALKVVVDGALIPEGRPLKRSWLKPTSIFSPRNIDTHFERAHDPRGRRVRALRELPEALQRFADLPYMAERCSWCQHTRFEHSTLRWPGSPMDGWSPCMAKNCDCTDMDQVAA